MLDYREEQKVIRKQKFVQEKPIKKKVLDWRNCLWFKEK